MGWAEKALQRHKLQKQIEEIMNSPEYKEIQRQQDEQKVLQALVRFCCIACDYLELKHNYKGNGIKNFLAFAVKRVCYTGEDEKYFTDYFKYAKEEYNVDIPGEFGLDIEEEGEGNE